MRSAFLDILGRSLSNLVLKQRRHVLPLQPGFGCLSPSLCCSNPGEWFVLLIELPGGRGRFLILDFGLYTEHFGTESDISHAHTNAASLEGQSLCSIFTVAWTRAAMPRSLHCASEREETGERCGGLQLSPRFYVITEISAS